MSLQQPVSSQMSLTLFEEMLATGTPITEAPRDVGFNRNNVFLDIADLGLAARRAVDACYFLVAQEPDQHQTYDYDLTYFKWLMSYDSNNRRHLKAVLREAQKAAIQVNEIDLHDPEKDRWISVPLLGSVGITGGRIVFEVHPTLQRNLKDPRSFTYLSLRITASFSSLHARVLYDHMSANAYRGGTEWIDLSVLREWFGASESKTLAEFKYLKRDVLEPAVAQINELSDLNVRYETRSAPGSKRIAKVRFIVQKKPEGAKALTAVQPLGSQELYITLKDEFGFGQTQFNELMEQREAWNDDRLWQAIEFTRTRIKQQKVTKSPAGFLMKAIRENLRLSSAEKTISAQQEAKAATVAQVDQAKANADFEQTVAVSNEIVESLTWFDTLAEEERALLVKEFARSPQAKLTCSRVKVTLKSLNEGVIRASDPLSRALGAFLLTKRG